MQVLRYLGRYTHRVAISNHRLLAFDGEYVTFRWKDYTHGGKQGQMKLRTGEFLRRFSCMCCPKRSYAFVTSDFSPIDSALLESPLAANYSLSFPAPPLQKQLPLSARIRFGIAPAVARR